MSIPPVVIYKKGCDDMMELRRCDNLIEKVIIIAIDRQQHLFHDKIFSDMGLTKYYFGCSKLMIVMMVMMMMIVMIMMMMTMMMMMTRKHDSVVRAACYTNIRPVTCPMPFPLRK